MFSVLVQCATLYHFKFGKASTPCSARAASMQVKRVYNVDSQEDFLEKVSRHRQPAILCGLDLGDAPELWTPQYLRERCGCYPVKVHVCPVHKMDFLLKNFAYKLNDYCMRIGN